MCFSAKTNSWDFIKTKNFCTAMETISGAKVSLHGQVLADGGVVALLRNHSGGKGICLPFPFAYCLEHRSDGWSCSSLPDPYILEATFWRCQRRQIGVSALDVIRDLPSQLQTISSRLPSCARVRNVDLGLSYCCLGFSIAFHAAESNPKRCGVKRCGWLLK